MNERIQELWSQSGGHYNSGNQNNWPEYTITDPEKFAELIVLECIDKAERYGLGCDAVEQLKEDFGVEE